MATYAVSSSGTHTLTLRRISAGAVIVYGRGDDLGNFKVFADQIEKDIRSIYKKQIRVISIELKKDFFDYLSNFSADSTIEELHVISHAIGGGLFLGYGGSAGMTSRVNAYKRAARLGRNVTYEEVRDAEIGAVLSDDFLNPSILRLQATIRSKFARDAFIKLWGCNAGVENWTYSDDDWDGDGVPDVYWSKLNERNVPKPSVAKAFARFFGVKVYGARSGSHVEVLDAGTWISSQDYKDRYGRWANPAHVPHRLAPDTGTYYEYNP